MVAPLDSATSRNARPVVRVLESHFPLTLAAGDICEFLHNPVKERTLCRSYTLESGEGAGNLGSFFGLRNGPKFNSLARQPFEQPRQHNHHHQADHRPHPDPPPILCPPNLFSRGALDEARRHPNCRGWRAISAPRAARLRSAAFGHPTAGGHRASSAERSVAENVGTPRAYSNVGV